MAAGGQQPASAAIAARFARIGGSFAVDRLSQFQCQRPFADAFRAGKKIGVRQMLPRDIPLQGSHRPGMAYYLPWHVWNSTIQKQGGF